MDDLERFLGLWVPQTAQGTYRAFAWWEGGFGVRNRQKFLRVTHPEDDIRAILSLVEEHEELFFYPGTFSRRSTKAEYSEPVPLLWLDLDTCNPDNDAIDYEWPTIWWETSDGHFQALWMLSQTPTLEERRELNRAAYEAHKELGADASYDHSRRLRLPGTKNMKPGRDGFSIVITHTTGVVCDIGALPHSQEKADLSKPVPGLRPASDPAVQHLMTTLPPDILQLHREEPPVGRRSDVLMKLLLKLSGLDLTDEEVYQIAWDAGSNKFVDRPQRLWREVLRARSMVEQPPPGFRVTVPAAPATGTGHAGEGVPQDPMEGWLPRSALPRDFTIKWQANPYMPRRSVMLVTGMPGTRKSWLVTDLAVSVAQGVSFQGVPIQDPGPVFYVAPDDEQERLSERVHLIEQKHECQKESELYWRQSGVHFADRYWADKLRAAMDVVHPKLVVFDGIYLMGYNAQDYGSTLPQLLVPLKEMCTEYDTSFVLVHHATRSRKDDNEDPRLSGQGSILLGAFFTVAWSLVNKGMDQKNRQKVQWNIGGKGTPGRPQFKLSFGSDTQRYDPRVTPGTWEDDDDDHEPRQGEF